MNERYLQLRLSFPAAKLYIFARILCLFIIATLSCPLSQADLSNQMNFNLGLDAPVSGAELSSKSGLLRFQLQVPPKMFRLQSAFTMVMGSNQRLGEFTLGGTIYPLSRWAENSRIQPFLGMEGLGAVGERNNKTALLGGYGFLLGTDLKVFGKRSGLTLSSEYVYLGQSSFRLWLGIYFLRL